MTIVEFLLARIAEDEAFARSKGNHWSACRLPVGGECSCTGSLLSRNRRALAECEAKRRVVEEIVHSVDVSGAISPTSGLALLQALALPHAHHSDYDRGWAL